MQFEDELSLINERGLRRRLRALSATGGKPSDGERTFLNFSSNDYLNLANDPRVKAAAIAAIECLGCGGTASRLMSGNLEAHEALEADLAEMIGGEAALLFGSGFLTNLGVLTALADRSAVIFSDRLNHASLVDGMVLSRATFHRYRHKDMDHLEDLLKTHTGTGRRIIVSDSVFSMDGDIAPVEDLHALAKRHGTLLIVDEAHALGVLGPNGAGLCRLHNIRPDVIIGTLSKALGSYGGFAVCSPSLREFLINRARSFIYSTALPPACVGGARCAVEIIRSTPDLGPALLDKVQTLHSGLADFGFRLAEPESQILAIHVGENDPAMKLSNDLWQKGLLATAIRPPTVPVGTARLRLSVTLAHSDEDLRQAIETLAATAREAGVL